MWSFERTEDNEAKKIMKNVTQTIVVPMGASVKVMRSYDYCHFEVALLVEPSAGLGDDDVNELRKRAARLADKAVEQYQQARKAADRIAALDGAKLHVKAAEAERVPEDARTPDHKAAIKAYADYCYHASYDYQDDWQDDQG